MVWVVAAPCRCFSVSVLAILRSLKYLTRQPWASATAFPNPAGPPSTVNHSNNSNGRGTLD